MFNLKTYTDVFHGEWYYHRVPPSAKHAKETIKEYHLPSYRAKYVCPPCRYYKKSTAQCVRRENHMGYQTTIAIPLAGEQYPTCPHCHQELTHVGPKFEPPARDDAKAWRKVEEELAKGENHRWYYSQAEFETRSAGWRRPKKSHIRSTPSRKKAAVTWVHPKETREISIAY